MARIKPLFSVLLASVLLSSISIGTAAPKSDLWDRWSAYDASSNAIIDHGVWDQLVARFIVRNPDGVNRFAYAQLRKPDKRQLTEYIQQLSQLPISRYNRDQQRAYWINLYNALTIAVVLEKYPVKSIRDISSGFLSSGPWDKKVITVEAEALTLNDIEHRILRPIWQDPRIHYALNCASIGCPNLQPQAFTGSNSDILLEQSAIEFINHPRAAQVVAGKLQVSSIYVWFIEDFGDSDEGVISHLKQYANDDLKLALNDIDEIDNDAYDWNINSASKPEIKKLTRQRGS